jgi:hypothetical protein
MKTKNLPLISKLIFFAIIFFLFSNFGVAQTEPVKTSAPDTTVSKKDNDEGKKDKAKRKDEFIIYTGANFNTLFVSSDKYESNIRTGWQLGFDYKRGKFFYWQVGLRYNNAVYNLKDMTMPADSISDPDNIFSIRDIDIPITGGINFLSAVNRVVALRLFISAVPAFAIGVGDNDVGITRDDINTFNMYGQAGLGVNVAFIVLEAGYNYGFSDMFQNAQSKPGQIFVNLGFRF